jgi:hypothetical protein
MLQPRENRNRGPLLQCNGPAINRPEVALQHSKGHIFRGASPLRLSATLLLPKPEPWVRAWSLLNFPRPPRLALPWPAQLGVRQAPLGFELSHSSDGVQLPEAREVKGEPMTAQDHYDNLDGVQRRDLLLKIGETREEARVLSERVYGALGLWVKIRLKRHLRHPKA